MTHQQRQQRLERLGEFARQEEDKAARRMAEARARLDEQQQRLSMLEDYQREYAARLSFNTGASSGVFALQNYRAFMARIEEAVIQQRQVVERMEQEHAKLAQAWNEQRTRSRGLHKVEEKLAATIARDQNSRDQRVQDEFAGRLHLTMTSTERG
ncbi:MAG: flagellar export protein FliJ [Pseudomonadota bacterium]